MAVFRAESEILTESPVRASLREKRSLGFDEGHVESSASKQE